jgi:hypothetical protein
LRKNYFAKIVNYIKKVFNIERSLNKLKDARKNPTYKTAQAVLPVLIGFLLRVRSFNELNNMIKCDEFKNILPKGMKLPQIDAIRDSLKTIDILPLRGMLEYGIKKARDNKVFVEGTIERLVVAAIDGTQTFNSDKKSCEHCLKAFKKGKREERNFHSSVAISTIGNGAKVVLDFEPYRAGEDEAKKDEGELTAAKRLIKRVSTNNERLIDVVVYDAIACNSEWMNSCIEVGLDTVVRVKNNNVDSIREIKKQVNKSEEIDFWSCIEGYESVKVYAGTFYMNNVKKPLRFVKFLMKKPDGRRSQIMIVTTCLEMDLRILFKIIRARQDIENSIFHNLKTECGLEHCFVHGGNAIEAVLCLMFIASNFIQLFYHRRIKKSVKTQVELVRKLLKGLYLLKRKPELIFDTG